MDSIEQNVEAEEVWTIAECAEKIRHLAREHERLSAEYRTVADSLDRYETVIEEEESSVVAAKPSFEEYRNLIMDFSNSMSRGKAWSPIEFERWCRRNYGPTPSGTTISRYCGLLEELGWIRPIRTPSSGRHSLWTSTKTGRDYKVHDGSSL